MMFKIGEFSKLAGVSVRMLRYYDGNGLLKPARVDGQSGYRLYTSSQVADLQRILLLRNMGFGVKEMALLLEDWHDENLQRELTKRKVTIEKTIEEEQKKLCMLEQLQRDTKAGHGKQNVKAVLKSIPGVHVVSVRRVLPDHFDEHILWELLAEKAKAKNWPIFDGVGNFSIYHDAAFKERDVDVEVCVVTDFCAEDEGDICFKTLPEVPHAVAVMVAGPFENINPSYIELARWLERHKGYRMLGTSRAITIKGPWNEEDPLQYLTEVLIPVRLKNT